jgi:hypothetical protein
MYPKYLPDATYRERKYPSSSGRKKKVNLLGTTFAEFLTKRQKGGNNSQILLVAFNVGTHNKNKRHQAPEEQQNKQNQEDMDRVQFGGKQKARANEDLGNFI